MKKYVKYSLIGVSGVIVASFLLPLLSYLVFGQEFVNQNTEAIGELIGRLLVYLTVFCIGIWGLYKLFIKTDKPDSPDEPK